MRMRYTGGLAPLRVSQCVQAMPVRRRILVLEQADDLGHVAGALAREGVEVGGRIAVVGTPAGAVEHIEVTGFAVGGAVELT